MDARFEELGEEYKAATTELRPECVCLLDGAGDVLWLSEGALGPDEHGAVRNAYESFAYRDSTGVAREDLGDNRLAVVLRAENDARVMAGAFLLILDSRSVSDPERFGDARFLDETAVNLLGRFARIVAPPLTFEAEPPVLRPAEPAPAPELLTRAVERDDRSHANVAPTTGESAPPAGAGGAVQAPTIPTLPPAAVNSFADASPPRTPASLASPALDKALAALRRVAITLHAQRLAPARRDTGIRRYEVLMRSPASTSAGSAPQRMLEQAAREGLGSVIDRRVFGELLAWLVRNRAVWEERPAMFSVNLSATSLLDDRFLEFVDACLRKASLPRGTIAFEVDAQVAHRSGGAFTRLATALQACGCPLVLDDFTWNESNVELLRSRGVRMLKLHPTMTGDVASDVVRRAQVAALVQLSRVLGLHIVAKRVEPGADQDSLVALGIDFLQSFAISPPLDLPSLAAQLAANRPQDTVQIPALDGIVT